MGRDRGTEKRGGEGEACYWREFWGLQIKQLAQEN